MLFSPVAVLVVQILTGALTRSIGFQVYKSLSILQRGLAFYVHFYRKNSQSVAHPREKLSKRSW